MTDKRYCKVTLEVVAFCDLPDDDDFDFGVALEEATIGAEGSDHIDLEVLSFDYEITDAK
jgi:hypothetical protein